MICSVFHFLGGYCKVSLHGSSQERFLNICVSRQILIWKLSRQGNHYIFYISKKGLEELDEISEKTGCSYRVLYKKGLPFLFYRYKKRKMFLAACGTSAIILYTLSLFLWQIRTEGCYSHSPEEILDYLSAQGIREGRLLSHISCGDLEERIRRDFKDIAWVSCDLKGTLLTVSVKETIDKEALKEKTSSSKPCNLVASKKGVIDSIMVRSGSALVKKGDKVKRGDLLISGAVELYDDSGELTETALVRADGDIKAVTKIKYHNSFPMLVYKKTYTGRRKESYSIMMRKKYYTFPGQKNPFQSFDEITTQKNLRIGQRLYLPVSIIIKKYLECSFTPQRYTNEEAIAEARKRLGIFLKEYEEKGVEILRNDVTIDCNENECVAKGKITVKESFGKIREIRQEEIPEIKNAKVLE